MAEEDIIKNGFRASDIVPFNPIAVNYDILNKIKSKNPVFVDHGENSDQHLQKFEENLKQILV